MNSPRVSHLPRWCAVGLVLIGLNPTLTACKNHTHEESGEPQNQLVPKKQDKAEERGQTSLLALHSRNALLEKSRTLSKILGSLLQAELGKALATGDPALAVQTCATVAPKMAAELSQPGQFKLQRVSLKPRNASNKADALDRRTLKEFEALNRRDSSAQLETLEQLGHGQLRYLGGIRIRPLCLTCHGKNIAAPMLKAIRKQYRQDRATGYELGDVRGAFRVEWTLPIPEGLEASNLQAPRPGVVTGGAPSTRDISRLKDLGFTRVIDLRPETESGIQERRLVRKSGMQYVRLPIRGPQDVNFKAAKALRKLLDEATSTTTFLHCATSNRAGALLALVAYQNGASVDTALDQGRAAGMTSLESRIKTLLLTSQSRSARKAIPD